MVAKVDISHDSMNVKTLVLPVSAFSVRGLFLEKLDRAELNTVTAVGNFLTQVC